MKPIFQRLTNEPEEGFVFRTVRGIGFNCAWHFHTEYELILVLEGSGYRIVGDSMNSLGPGDMVLVGPGLPHIWQEELAGGAQQVHALLIQFESRFLENGLLHLPALEPVRRLLVNARRGLHVTGPTRTKVSALMCKMSTSKGVERIAQFLQLLGLLGDSKHCHPIVSPGFASKLEAYDEERMDRVFQYLSSRIDDQELRLCEVAQMAHLSEGAFSRFFRAHTGKTFPAFVNELRIGRACRLLTESESSVTEVAFKSGFTNLSNFNRQFLKLKSVSPREFRRQIKQRLPNAY